MATSYCEIPINYSDIEPFVLSDVETMKKLFFQSKRLVFYDACSFQRHSYLDEREMQILIKYYKMHNSAIIIIRGVLIELVGEHHILNQSQIKLIKRLHDNQIEVVIFSEEYLFDILSECFSDKQRINEYLMWAIRNVKSPVSTIERTLAENLELSEELLKAKNLRKTDLYQKFFCSVRDNKEKDDDLGEDLIALCVHILSNLPGINNSKLCVVTDDRKAAIKINSAIRKKSKDDFATKIILFSTAKLVQHIYQEQIDVSEDEMIKILSSGLNGNIVVMGITDYDLDVNPKISLTCKQLAQKIRETNEIVVIF